MDTERKAALRDEREGVERLIRRIREIEERARDAPPREFQAAIWKLYGVARRFQGVVDEVNAAVERLTRGGRSDCAFELPPKLTRKGARDGEEATEEEATEEEARASQASPARRRAGARSHRRS